MDRNQKLHEGRALKEYNHQCRYDCNQNITVTSQKAIFDDFWKLGTWELQTSFLNGVIEIENVKRKSQLATHHKNVSCIYKLGGFRVCKQFFMKTLDVSNKRLQNVVNKKKVASSGIACRDQRGKKGPTNKIPQERIDVIQEHINKFPRYVSHYSREKTSNVKYLDPRLDLKKMYTLYVSFCQEEKHVEPVKESFYRHIFNTKFNLSFHRPLTDTCVTCDKLQVTIEHGNEDSKREAQIQKELHLRKAECAKQAKDECHNVSDDNQVALCFDLQKMMPTPHVTNSKAYYYRQLWTYNLNIHNLATGNAQMYIWHEGQASRGCQEIASCLLKFVNTLPQNVKHITAFSDNCGGQNKSHIIVKFWLYVVKCTHIESVNHRFLISGHSYNECDQDFGLVEIKKRQNKRDLYVPEHWAELIASSSRKFMVVQMQDEDFLTLDPLTPYFRKTVPGIRGMQWLHFKKETPYTLYYKTVCENLVESFLTLEMKAANRTGRNAANLPELPVMTEKPKLKYLKYTNLMDLLNFVPPIYHGFYQNLPHLDNPGPGPSRNTRATRPAVPNDEDDEDLENTYDTDF